MKNKNVIISVGVIFFFLLFIIPFIINESYKLNCGYATLWGAADVLSFYAEFLGAVGTIGLGFLTLWQNHIITEENDNAQKRLEEINKRANEINIINKIIEIEDKRYKKLQNTLNDFYRSCSFETISSAKIYDRVQYLNLQMKSNTALNLLSQELQLHIHDNFDFSELERSAKCLYDEFNRCLDVIYDEKINKPECDISILKVLMNDYFDRMKDCLSYFQMKLSNIISGSLSLDDIRGLYNYTFKELINDGKAKNALGE